MFKTNAGQVVIRLTPDQWHEVGSMLQEIVDATAKTHPDAAGWAEAVRDILYRESESPAQQAAERAEALGDETDF